MKTERTPKFLKKHKDPFKIRSVDISPEKEITDLVRSVIRFGTSAHRKEDTPDAQVPAPYVKALVSIATNVWRSKKKMMDAATGEIREGMKPVDRHIEAIRRNLLEVGIQIHDHTGETYDEGQPMKVIATKPTRGPERQHVSETLLPSIFWNNRLIQNGEIEIATPLLPNAPTELQNPTP
jgi:hypothetical protein